MRPTAAFSTLLLLAACRAPPPPMTAAEIVQIEEEVLAAVEARFDALRRLDMESVLLAAHPEVLVWPNGGRILSSAEYREGMYAWAQGKESWEGGWIDTTVRVLSPDLAVFSGTYVDTIEYSDGRRLHCPACSAVFLFERTVDGWKYTLGAGSSAPAQPVEEG